MLKFVTKSDLCMSYERLVVIVYRSSENTNTEFDVNSHLQDHAVTTLSAVSMATVQGTLPTVSVTTTATLAATAVEISVEPAPNVSSLSLALQVCGVHVF